jgi:hypothetical protein
MKELINKKTKALVPRPAPFFCLTVLPKIKALSPWGILFYKKDTWKETIPGGYCCQTNRLNRQKRPSGRGLGIPEAETISPDNNRTLFS